MRLTHPVLVVEDDPICQRVAEALLERLGHRVETVSSGLDALAALKAGRHFELIFMDFMMPEMDGPTTVREIRRRYPDNPVPIVAMTARVTPEDRALCIAAGMDDYLGKPITLRSLRHVLRQWCG